MADDSDEEQPVNYFPISFLSIKNIDFLLITTFQKRSIQNQPYDELLEVIEEIFSSFQIENFYIFI